MREGNEIIRGWVWDAGGEKTEFSELDFLIMSVPKYIDHVAQVIKIQLFF